MFRFDCKSWSEKLRLIRDHVEHNECDTVQCIYTKRKMSFGCMLRQNAFLFFCFPIIFCWSFIFACSFCYSARYFFFSISLSLSRRSVLGRQKVIHNEMAIENGNTESKYYTKCGEKLLRAKCYLKTCLQTNRNAVNFWIKYVNAIGAYSIDRYTIWWKCFATNSASYKNKWNKETAIEHYCNVTHFVLSFFFFFVLLRPVGCCHRSIRWWNYGGFWKWVSIHRSYEIDCVSGKMTNIHIDFIYWQSAIDMCGDTSVEFIMLCSSLLFVSELAFSLFVKCIAMKFQHGFTINVH